MLYNAFTPQNMQQGKYWVVGDINGLSTELRWQEETPVFADIILKKIVEKIHEFSLQLPLQREIKILDYGCGCGRIAKGILDKNTDIKIVAVDQSENMLSLAKEYNKDYIAAGKVEFLTVPEFDEKYSGQKFDLGYCIYVLQHVPNWDLRATVNRISGHCDRLLLVDSLQRMAVPKFEDDQVNVIDEIRQVYNKFENAIPGQVLFDNIVIRTMFLTGGIRHGAFWCEK